MWSWVSSDTSEGSSGTSNNTHQGVFQLSSQHPSNIRAIMTLLCAQLSDMMQCRGEVPLATPPHHPRLRTHLRLSTARREYSDAQTRATAAPSSAT